MSLPIHRSAKPEAGDVTPYDAYVADASRVLRGEPNPMPGRGDLVAHQLSHRTDACVVTLTVTDRRIRSGGRDLPHAQAVLQDAWRTGRADRSLLAALGRDGVDVAGTHALVVLKVPVRGGRTVGFGFAAGLPTETLWDEAGPKSDRFHAFLVRRYGGGEAREQATLVRQRDLARREADVTVPTSRAHAVRLALEHALRRAITWWLPADVLDHLTGELRLVVEANLDALWDDARDEPRDCTPRDLVRWTP